MGKNIKEERQKEKMRQINKALKMSFMYYEIKLA